MTTWVLNTVGLLATTIGVLMVFLHLHRTSATAPEGTIHQACVKDRKMLKVTFGLMAAWFVIQSVAIIL